jgi:hypothetical protein
MVPVKPEENVAGWIWVELLTVRVCGTEAAAAYVEFPA